MQRGTQEFYCDILSSETAREIIVLVQWSVKKPSPLIYVCNYKLTTRDVSGLRIVFSGSIFLSSTKKNKNSFAFKKIFPTEKNFNRKIDSVSHKIFKNQKFTRKPLNLNLCSYLMKVKK